MELKIITSKDGSHTLWRDDIKENYHSIHGAIQESQHVFIEKGLFEISKKKQDISVLEVGFGTGLNAFLTFVNSNCKINYTGIEAFPVSADVINQLNYSSEVKSGKEQHVFEKIHTTKWEDYFEISTTFQLKKNKGEIQLINIGEGYDLVYYDAFGPVVQPEMWSPEIFKKLYQAMNNGGVFVTYCAKGQVRRDLQSVGFTVERLDGPPGKREMLRARKL